MVKPRRRIRDYSNEDLLMAVKLVRANVLSLGQASKKYHVPRATISDHTTGKLKKDILKKTIGGRFSTNFIVF